MPEFVFDRGLGKRVAAALRDAGLVLHTLPEIFGSEAAAQKATDIEWIAIAGTNGWAALSKDRRIRHVRQERDAVAEHRVPVFSLANANLNFAQMAGAFLVALPRIVEICDQDPGGCIWIVQRTGTVERWWPAPQPPADGGEDT